MMIVVIFYFWKWRKIQLLSKCCIWTCITYLLLISAGSVAQYQKNNDEQVSIESYFEVQHPTPSHYYDNRTILQEKAKFNQRKSLLCATFLDSSNQLARKNAMKNVAATASSCDWVFIIYKGVKCNKDGKYKSSSISCHVSTIRHVYSYIFQQAQVIPKALLYFDLLPFITNYQYILLVDEDVSIESFNFKLYEHILRCSFYPLPPPMISQGLISDEFIPFPFFKPTTWKEKPFLSTETNLIEQQIPIMNSLFFGWFVENIIYPSIPMILENGNTWGMDHIWCKAADYFAKEILRSFPADDLQEGYIPCLLVLNPHGTSTSSHARARLRGKSIESLYSFKHLHFKTLQLKHVKPALYRGHGAAMIKYFNETYPSWFQSPPIDSRPEILAKNWKMISSLSSSCPSDNS